MVKSGTTSAMMWRGQESRRFVERLSHPRWEYLPFQTFDYIRPCIWMPSIGPPGTHAWGAPSALIGVSCRRPWSRQNDRTTCFYIPGFRRQLPEPGLWLAGLPLRTLGGSTITLQRRQSFNGSIAQDLSKCDREGWLRFAGRRRLMDARPEILARLVHDGW